MVCGGKEIIYVPINSKWECIFTEKRVAHGILLSWLFGCYD